MLMLHHVVSCCLCTIILLHEAIASSNVKVNFDLNTVTPSGVGADQAVDGRTVTAWRLPDGQTTADLNATTTRPYTVNRLVLTLTVTSAVPHSTRVSVIGDNVTWTVFINRTCNDTFYHWTSYSELTNCVVASRITEVRAPDNVFWARNESSGELVWRTTFTRAEMAIRGEESDFSNNNYNFFNISELQLFAFSDGGDTTNCNCDPTGVKSLRRPCNTTTGTCRCRRMRFHSDYDFNTACRPEIIPLHRNITPYHGPLSGGTIVVFLGVFLRKPSSITVGDRYPCWENFTNNPYNDTGVVCITTAADAEHLNISMPFHICWETSDVMSCIITHDEYTYRPEPSVTGLSRSESLAKGGLPITIYGHNFDSIYGYVGNPLIPLEHYPHIGIWVGKKVEGGPEFFELDRSRRRPVLCSVPNSNELTCRTPEVSVARNILEDLVSYKPNPVQLRVYLGTGSDILTNRNTSFRFPFVVYKNPTIKQWGSVQSFQIWDDQEIIRITGQDFRKCCSKNDYEVTVGGVHCPILVLQSNAMSCAPSKTKPEPTIFDRDGGSRVLLKVGSYEFVVGYLKYEVTLLPHLPHTFATVAATQKVTWIDNDKNRTYVIGGACGLAGAEGGGVWYISMLKWRILVVFWLQILSFIL